MARVAAGGQGAEIRFALAEGSLRALLVAASDKGICAILEDDPRLGGVSGEIAFLRLAWRRRWRLR